MTVVPMCFPRRERPEYRLTPCLSSVPRNTSRVSQTLNQKSTGYHSFMTRLSLPLVSSQVRSQRAQDTLVVSGCGQLWNLPYLCVERGLIRKKILNSSRLYVCVLGRTTSIVELTTFFGLTPTLDPNTVLLYDSKETLFEWGGHPPEWMSVVVGLIRVTYGPSFGPRFLLVEDWVHSWKSLCLFYEVSRVWDEDLGGYVLQ